jgi:hypothetical protein
VYVVTSAHEIPADVEAMYHELLERLGPAERAELARLLLDDGARCRIIIWRPGC